MYLHCGFRIRTTQRDTGLWRIVNIKILGLLGRKLAGPRSIHRGASWRFQMSKWTSKELLL